jgi:replicative DNA helicase
MSQPITNRFTVIKGKGQAFGPDQSTITLPQHPEAEYALVNLACNYPEMLYRLEEAGVLGEMFHDPSASFVFETLRTLTEEGKGAHPTGYVVTTRLKSNPDYREFYEFYKKASSLSVPREWFGRYLDQLISAYKKREQAKAALELLQLACDTQVSAEAGTAFMFDEAERIDRTTSPLNIMDGAAWATTMEDYYANAPDLPLGAPFGISTLDNATGGSRYGEMTVLFAEPGMGKSALLQQAAYHRARLGMPQLWITIGDMDSRQVWHRLMQQITGVSSISLTFGNFSDRQGFDYRNKVLDRLQELKGLPFFICEDTKMQSGDVRRIIKHVLRKLPEDAPGLHVYVDYLQQMKNRAEGIYELTKEVSADLLDCAHSIQDDSGRKLVALSAISSVNKSGEHTGAKDIAHDAENVFKLEPAKPNEKGPDPSLPPEAQSGVIKLILIKQRGGGKGTLKLWFDAPRAAWRDMTGREP